MLDKLLKAILDSYVSINISISDNKGKELNINITGSEEEESADDTEEWSLSFEDAFDSVEGLQTVEIDDKKKRQDYMSVLRRIGAKPGDGLLYVGDKDGCTDTFTISEDYKLINSSNKFPITMRRVVTMDGGIVSSYLKYFTLLKGNTVVGNVQTMYFKSRAKTRSL